MRTLQNLARFIRAKDTDEERHEIREYVTTYAADLAEAFGMPEDTFTAGIVTETDDARLARRLLFGVKTAQKERRDHRAAARIATAQASADVLGSVAVWEGDRASIDVMSVLASCLTCRSGVLIFTCDAFTVSIPMSCLFDLVRLDRFDLTGYVDAKGLHVRWGSGGLNFCSRLDANAERILVHLPARADSRAA
jgi:hypothetical protein